MLLFCGVGFWVLGFGFLDFGFWVLDFGALEALETLEALEALLLKTCARGLQTSAEGLQEALKPALERL